MVSANLFKDFAVEVAGVRRDGLVCFQHALWERGYKRDLAWDGVQVRTRRRLGMGAPTEVLGLCEDVSGRRSRWNVQ